MSTRARSTVSLCLFLLATGVSGCRTSPEAKEERFLKRGQALVARKEYQRAVLEFRNASSVIPKDAEPYYQTGLAYLENSDLANAVRALNRAITLNPKHPGAQLKMSALTASTRDAKLINEAVSRIQGVFGASPADPEAVEALAIAEWKLGKPEEAAERIEEALKKFPAHLQSSQFLARMKMSKNDWNGAEEVLKKAVADAPKSSSAALALGEFYAFVRQFEKAQLTLRKSVQLDPTNGAALVARAGVQTAVKNVNEAEQTYRQASALSAKPYKPLHAMFLYEIGKTQESVAELQGLVKSDPDDRGSRTALLMAYIGMKQIPQAEDVLPV